MTDFSLVGGTSALFLIFMIFMLFLSEGVFCFEFVLPGLMQWFRFVFVLVVCGRGGSRREYEIVGDVLWVDFELYFGFMRGMLFGGVLFHVVIK